jgi:hypothetical protein
VPRIITEGRFLVCDSSHKFNRISQNGTPMRPVNTHTSTRSRHASQCTRVSLKRVSKTEHSVKMAGLDSLEGFQIEPWWPEAGPVLPRGRRGFLEQFRNFRFQYLTLLCPKRSEPKRL